MLYAYYNMPIQDFIAQLRTYVIAMGLSPQVVDCVDNLASIDELEEKHATELEKVKDDIYKAVETWANKNLAEDAAAELLSVVEDA